MIDQFEHTDEWQKVKNAAMNTIGKTKGKYPTSDWKLRMLMAEHSPIRLIKIYWRWKGIKYWIAMHFRTHHLGIEHFISTQRPDRTGITRDDLPQSNLVNHVCEADAAEMIYISRKRLCNLASPETRKAWQEVKDITKTVEPELASRMVRECVYRNGLCPEICSCGFNKTEAFQKELGDYLEGFEEQTSLFGR